MFPPVPTSDEHEILRGGFGGIAWIYTFVVAVGLAVTIVLIPLASYFWLRSSRFVLTDRRLVVKPRIGRSREVSIEQLQGAKIAIGTATGTVAVDGPIRLRLRYQRHPEQLWGALLVLCHWPMPSTAPPSGARFAWSAQTLRNNSRMTQAGLGVLCGDQLAFLPNNSGLQKGGIGKTAVLAAVGMREVTVRAEFPVIALVEALIARGGDFASHVATLAETLGGLVCVFTETRRQPSRRGLLETIGDERLDMVADEGAASALIAR